MKAKRMLVAGVAAVALGMLGGCGTMENLVKNADAGTVAAMAVGGLAGHAVFGAASAAWRAVGTAGSAVVGGVVEQKVDKK